MTSSASKRGLLAPIASREDALKAVRDSSTGFFVLAAIQGLVGMFILPSTLVDAAVLFVLGVILRKRHSRTAAVLLLVLSIVMGVVTLLNRIGMISAGGNNVFLALIMVVVASRAVEATFKLRGRFSLPRPTEAQAAGLRV